MLSAASKFSCATFCSSPFSYIVLKQLFLAVISHSLIHFAYNLPHSLLFTFSAFIPLPPPVCFWFTYTLTHSSPPSLYTPLLFVPFPLSPPSSGLLSPPSFLLMSHQSCPQGVGQIQATGDGLALCPDTNWTAR